MSLHTISLKRTYNIKDNGADYTQQLIDAEAESYANVQAGNAVLIKFPSYSVKHSDTWVIRGSQGGAPWVQGKHGGGFSSWGSSLNWGGALPANPETPDKPQVYFQECNKGRWWDVAVDGNDVAGRNLWVGASEWNEFGNLKATSGFSIKHSKLCRVRPGREGNGCVTMGTDPEMTGGDTFQCSEFSLSDLILTPESSGAEGFSWAGMKGHGFRTLSAGNCKIGELVNIGITAAHKAVDWERSSGFLSVRNIGMGDVHQAFAANSGALDVSGYGIECGHTDDFRLLTGTIQFGGFASIRCGYANWRAAEGVNPILLVYAAGLLLEHNYFRCNDDTPFKMVHGCLTQGQGGSFRSRQNHYYGCGSDHPYIPLWDGETPANNHLAPIPNTYGGTTVLNVKSSGDTGGLGYGFRLQDFDSTTN